MPQSISINTVGRNGEAVDSNPGECVGFAHPLRNGTAARSRSVRWIAHFLAKAAARVQDRHAAVSKYLASVNATPTRPSRLPSRPSPWLAIPLALLLSAGSAQAQNLVVNGDFEANPVTGWVIAGDFTLVFDGSAFFGCTNTTSCLTTAYIRQDIATVPGQSYTLTFRVRNSGQPSELQLHWFDAAGAPSPAIASGVCTGTCVYQAAQNAVGTGGLPTPDGIWAPVTRTVVATSTTMRLHFTGYNLPGAVHVDDVSLTLPLPLQPAAPTATVSAPGTAQATVTWVAPADGGSPITGFAVASVEDSTKTCTGAAADTSCTVPGLTFGAAYTFTVAAANANGPGPASPASNAVTPAVALLANTTPALPGGTVGVAYGASLTATGGTAPYVWSASNLPPGLTIANGVLSGAPTQAGSFNVSLDLSDSAPTAQTTPAQSHTVVIAAAPVVVPPPAITTGTLPGATEGEPYSHALQATGGTAPYTWAVASGSLPPGLTLDPATGVLSGTAPKVAVQTSKAGQVIKATGTFSFGVQVTDSSSPQLRSAVQQLSLQVTAAGVVLPAPTPVPSLGAWALVLLNLAAAVMGGLAWRWRRKPFQA